MGRVLQLLNVVYRRFPPGENGGRLIIFGVEDVVGLVGPGVGDRRGSGAGVAMRPPFSESGETKK